MKYFNVLIIICITAMITYFFRWKIIGVLRKVCILKEPRISKEHALEIGKLEYEKRGCNGWNPTILEQRKAWMIWANKNVVGPTWLKIDKKSGEVLKFITPLR